MQASVFSSTPIVDASRLGQISPKAGASGGSRPGDCIGTIGVSEADRDSFEGQQSSP